MSNRFKWSFCVTVVLAHGLSLQASDVQYISQSSWVLPESITPVSSFGSLTNSVLIPDDGTSYVYAVSLSNGQSTLFSTLGTPTSFFGGEGTGSPLGGLILNSGPLAGNYVVVGNNYTDPANGVYSSAVFTVSPAGASKLIFQNSAIPGSDLVTPLVAPAGFGSLAGSLLATQGTSTGGPGAVNNISIITPTSSGSATLSTFVNLPIDPFGMVAAPSGFGRVGGDLLVSSFASGTILAVDAQGNITTFANLSLLSGQSGLRQMAFAPAGFGQFGGDLFVSVGASTTGGGIDGQIDVLNSDGVLVAVLDEGSIGNPFDPRGIYFASNTQVYISDADPGLVIADPAAFTSVPEPGTAGAWILSLAAVAAAFRKGFLNPLNKQC